MDKRKSGVYAVLLDGRIRYVGCSRNLQNRFRQHRKNLRGHRHANKDLQAEFDVSENKDLNFRILEECKNYLEREPVWIKRFGLENLTNIDMPDGKGGIINKVVSVETRQKISDKFAEYRRLGITYKRSEQDRKQISERAKHYWKKHSPEKQKRLREQARKEVKRLWQDLEYRKHMSEAHKGKTNPNQAEVSRKVCHERWHTRRGIYNKNCVYCRKEENADKNI